MKFFQTDSAAKARTGILGLDELTHGGLPRGRTTLLLGGPGAGKTVLALQSLVNGARVFREPGIFVAFEENSPQIVSNAASFGWDLPRLQQRRLFFLDAQPCPDVIQAGSFDLLGMLSALESKVREIGAKRIVFDSVDVVLALLSDPIAQRRELYRLRSWLLNQKLTAIITAKATATQNSSVTLHSELLPFMVDAVLMMKHELSDGVSQRGLHVLKYRGSAFAENETPFVIGEKGFDVAGPVCTTKSNVAATNKRVSSGIRSLDEMLGGGYIRNSSVLITGLPGTAKSTLAGAFVEAACRRGDRAVFISFDSEPPEVIRNLASVNIMLGRHARNGLLTFCSLQSGTASAEMHFMRIRSLVSAFGARCLVIDPISALYKQGNERTAYGVVERLTRWAKAESISLLCTSLLDSVVPECEGTPLQISTIADTWIHLAYRVQAGERNRSLTIVKSRGSAHSNQVRELILGSTGVRLEDVYTAGGDVLMGTLRWEKEEAVRAEQERQQAEFVRNIETIEQKEEELQVRMRGIRQELHGKRSERERLKRLAAQANTKMRAHRTGIGRRRSGGEQPR